jgi:hypothetical protein
LLASSQRTGCSRASSPNTGQRRKLTTWRSLSQHVPTCCPKMLVATLSGLPSYRARISGRLTTHMPLISTTASPTGTSALRFRHKSNRRRQTPLVWPFREFQRKTLNCRKRARGLRLAEHQLPFSFLAALINSIETNVARESGITISFQTVVPFNRDSTKQRECNASTLARIVTLVLRPGKGRKLAVMKSRH